MYERAEEYELASEYVKRLFEANPDVIEVIKDTVRILLKNGEDINAERALDEFASRFVTEDGYVEGIESLVEKLNADIEEWRLESEQE